MMLLVHSLRLFCARNRNLDHFQMEIVVYFEVTVNVIRHVYVFHFMKQKEETIANAREPQR